MATYYVSNSGDDGDDGSIDAPWASLPKVNSTSFDPGDSILFARDSFWIGELRASNSGSNGSPITYGAYGTGTAAPLISNSTPLSAGSWSKTGGRTNVYQISVSGGDIDTVWSGSWFGVWDTNYRSARKAASIAAVDATAGTCYYDTTTDILYLHTWDSSNPASDGLTYWVTLYQIAVSSHGYDDITFSGLETLFAGSHGFATFDPYSGIPWRVSTRATFTSCKNFGSMHNGFSLLGTTINATDCEVQHYCNDGGFALADARVADPSNPATNGITLSRCTAGINTIYGGRTALAFKVEGTPSNLTLTDVKNTGECSAAFYLTGATASNLSINRWEITGAVGIALSDDASTTVTIDNLVMTARASAYGIIVGTTSGLIIRNSRLKGTLAALAMGATADAKVYKNLLDGGAVYGVLMSAGGSHEIINNVIIGGYGAIWTDATLITADVLKNNIFLNCSSALFLNSSANVVEDYNCAWNCTWWAADALTLADYRIATGDGVHSFEANPLFVNAANDDYRITKSSPCYETGVVTAYNSGYTGATADVGLHEVRRKHVFWH